MFDTNLWEKLLWELVLKINTLVVVVSHWTEDRRCSVVIREVTIVQHRGAQLTQKGVYRH